MVLVNIDILIVDKVELGDTLDSSYGEEQSGNYVTQTPIIEEIPDTSSEETPEITDEEEIPNIIEDINGIE